MLPFLSKAYCVLALNGITRWKPNTGINSTPVVTITVSLSSKQTFKQLKTQSHSLINLTTKLSGMGFLAPKHSKVRHTLAVIAHETRADTTANNQDLFALKWSVLLEH